MRRAIGYFGRGLLFLVIALCCAVIVVPPFLDRIYYIGPQTGHFDGARFFNPDRDTAGGVPSRGGIAASAWRYVTGADGRPAWPDRVAVSPSKPVARVDGQRMVVTWIGHASALVQTNGLNILTDPIWSDVAGPFGVGPSRVAAPGIRFDDLPKIDLVVVSHNHYDHMDLATLKRLWDRDKPLIVTSLGNDTLLQSAGIEAKAVDWGQKVLLPNHCYRSSIPLPCDGPPDAEIVVTRNHHWGSRWGVDSRRALWSSFVVILPGGNLFFAGDTGFGDGGWPHEAAKLGSVRLALIPIGAFRFTPGQMDVGSHIGPVQASEVFARLRAAHAIGIHWGTFRLSSEAYDTPPKLLAAVMKCRGLAGFDTVALGAPTEIGPYASPKPPAAAMDACRARPEYAAFK
jgi:L-ascorbate metabolism protein UlaG (beta-lactamase superfamily)